MKVDLYHGNCLNEMKKISDNSVDSIVTDPPYGISFMGKEWDHSVPSKEVWKECFRVLKPGGHLLAFAGTRTQHRMAVNIEDSGFEIRDMIAWVYGSGFPKSMNISKAIDKAAGVEREVVGQNQDILKKQSKDLREGKRKILESYNCSNDNNRNNGFKTVSADITAPATNNAKKWDGWGTALKPALEPITVARKPLSEKTIVANVLKHGTGGLNIDDCRIESNGDNLGGGSKDTNNFENKDGLDRPWMHDKEKVKQNKEYVKEKIKKAEQMGRFPANFIHDGSEEVLENFPDSNGSGKARTLKRSVKPEQDGWGMNKNSADEVELNDAGTGSAARFFYVAKASGKERNEGLTNTTNTHPTIKPIALMRYLVKLVTPKNGTVLDPFMGSGTTGKSALQEGMNFIGIELDDKYFQVAKERIEYEQNKPSLENFFD